MQIQIIDIKQVNHPTKTPGKTTPKLDIAYKNLSFGNKTEGKALFSFGSSEGAFKVLLDAHNNDIYEIERKKEGDFQNWVNAKKLDAATVEAPQPASTGGTISKSTGYSPVAKSTYETPEERAVKQIYIVRQSSIAQAVSLLATGAKAPPEVDKVIGVAKQFEEYVFGSTKEKIDVTTAFDDLDTLDDVPL